MFYVNANYTDFEHFQQAASNWDLDFRLLSKNNLETGITIFTSGNFQLSRVRLSGKIDQYGLCPEGYRSIVIPVPGGSFYNWFNQLSQANEIQIYPKDGTIDGISFNQFCVNVFAIKEHYLLQCIENMKYSVCQNRFGGSEQRIKSTNNFCERFYNYTTQFFLNVENRQSFTPSGQSEIYLKRLLQELLLHIELSEEQNSGKISAKRNHGLNKAIELINEHLEESITISSLCKIANLSERSLQYAFKEKYQVTPKEYIKAVKLNKVREELVHDGDKSKISAIAAKYGFWHMGQFAADYKNWFGELPKETVKI